MFQQMPVMKKNQKAVQLSDRQSEVVNLVAQGLPDKRIADELDISEETVGHHLKVVFKKLGIHSRVQLVAWIIGHPTNA
jgi:DNA-binding NarL/FixJ family response regulator